MHDSATVANRLLELAGEAGKTLTPMQLLKLVYIAHGWALGLYGVPLIKDEVQAWQYGPVIPRLYNRIRKYRSQPVTSPIPSDDADDLTPRNENLIEQIFRIYGSRTGPALSRITHADGTPWQKTYVPGSFGLVIPNDLIEDHYNSLANRAA
jgi:uncharacterized phage-associated protein